MSVQQKVAFWDVAMEKEGAGGIGRAKDWERGYALRMLVSK